MTHISHSRNPSYPATGSPESAGSEDDAPLITDAQLCNRLGFLLTASIQRQVWLFLLDSEQRLIEPIMPMNDHPHDPHELHATDDLGRVTFPQVFITRARQVAALVGAASYVIVWERLGSERFSENDMHWLRAFLECAAEAEKKAGARLRRLLLLHDHGLKLVDSKDLG